MRLYKALSKLGHTVEPDPHDPALFLRKTNFASADESFSINCVKQIKGVELGTQCIVTANSEKSIDGITSVKAGAVANVTVIKFLDKNDVAALANSVTLVKGYFQTFEKVRVVLPNGSKAEVPKVRIECKVADATNCHATMF